MIAYPPEPRNLQGSIPFLVSGYCDSAIAPDLAVSLTANKYSQHFWDLLFRVHHKALVPSMSFTASLVAQYLSYVRRSTRVCAIFQPRITMTTPLAI